MEGDRSSQIRQSGKSYYKIGEVAEMLGVSIYTLKYWETQFDELDPPRRNRHRRYTPADIEIVKRIMKLLYVRKYRIEAAKEAMKGFVAKPQLHAPERCKSARGAIRLLTEAAKRIDDPGAKVRIENVLEWLLENNKVNTDSQN